MRFPKIQLFEKIKNNNYIGKSKFISPYIAPEQGYADVWRYRRTVLPKIEERVGLDVDRDQVVFFRVRTKQAQDGKIIRALYGKIYGGIISDIGAKKNISIRFTYYLNPDGTRNMEYDPEENLFKSRLSERYMYPNRP